MFKKIKGFFLRLFIFILYPFLNFVDFLNPRFFMLIQIKLLKLRGVIFTGNPRYISTKVKFDFSSQISIGERVVVSDNVIFLTHDYSLTTIKIASKEYTGTDVAILKNITIGNNVFIGMNSILLPGTKIEDNVIIGAGSVVRGLVTSNSVLLGNPAQYVCSINALDSKRKKLDIDSIKTD